MHEHVKFKICAKEPGQHIKKLLLYQSLTRLGSTYMLVSTSLSTWYLWWYYEDYNWKTCPEWCAAQVCETPLLCPPPVPLRLMEDPPLLASPSPFPFLPHHGSHRPLSSRHRLLTTRELSHRRLMAKSRLQQRRPAKNWRRGRRVSRGEQNNNQMERLTKMYAK